MKIAIFGATGGTGKELLQQALERGHEVTAVARRPEAVTTKHERLRVVAGDAMDLASVERAVAGQEAVLSTLGPNKMFFATTQIYSVASMNVARAMEKQGIKRLIAVTSAGTEDADPGFFIVYRLVLKPMLQRVYDDAKIFEQELAKTSLDWTVVRPGRITDGPKTGKFNVSPRFLPKGQSFAISRADLASFMLDELEHPKFIRGTPTLRG